jgi:hypothetical protein
LHLRCDTSLIFKNLKEKQHFKKLKASSGT